ncbi:MAG: AbrB/MazE/SpoVT family DNA-binding domain-containing protein [Nanoarchaeota archaeon]|nr:AbrB/MazE/SpoVT family DNA-binding domain-containing protein [Nanoarchaeota archaeon]
MTEITKMSSKGQVVIPYDMRKDLGLDTGSTLVVSRTDDLILLKKVQIPDPKEEFKKLTKWGQEFAKKKGIKEEDVMKIIHKGRGIKGA